MGHGSLDLAVAYPDVDGARSEIAWLQSRGELDPQRVYLVVGRPTPKDWRVVPEQVVVAAQRSFSTPETVGAPCDNQTLSADSSRSTRGVA